MAGEITDVRKVMRINGDGVYMGRDVNAFLEEGWLLLYVYSESGPSDHGPTQTPWYVLGWALSSPPPYFVPN